MTIRRKPIDKDVAWSRITEFVKLIELDREVPLRLQIEVAEFLYERLRLDLPDVDRNKVDRNMFLGGRGSKVGRAPVVPKGTPMDVYATQLLLLAECLHMSHTEIEKRIARASRPPVQGRTVGNYITAGEGIRDDLRSTATRLGKNGEEERLPLTKDEYRALKIVALEDLLDVVKPGMPGYKSKGLWRLGDAERNVLADALKGARLADKEDACTIEQKGETFLHQYQPPNS